MSLRDPYARAVIRDFPEAYLRLNESLSASAAILADGPLAYWRLNDAEGYQQAVLCDDPRGFWRLNGNANDESGYGPNNGTVHPVVNFGQGGPLSNGTTAARFLASGSGATDAGGYVAATITAPGTKWTFEIWLKRKGAPTSTRMALTVDPLMVQVQQNSNVLVVIHNGVAVRITGTVSVVDNQWHHVALTCDGTTTRLYVDGVLDGTYVGTISVTGTALRIGGFFGGGYIWDGYLSHVAYWNSALTLGQIKNHVGLKTSTITTMARTTIVDAVGAYPGTKLGGVTLGQPGAMADGSTGALFDGATGYVNTAASGLTAQANSFSAEGWVNHQGLPWNPTYYSMVWVAGSGTYLAVHTSGQVMMSTYVGGTQVFTLGGVVVPTSGWHHIAATWDGNGDRKVRVFLDGALTVTGPALAAGTLEGGYWKLGMYDANHRMNGAIDEVAVYSKVLTPGQIQNHYKLRTSTVVGGAGLPALVDSTGHSHTGTLIGASALGEVSALGDGTTCLHLFANGTGVNDTGGYATAPVPALGSKWTVEVLLKRIGAPLVNVSPLSIAPLYLYVSSGTLTLRVYDVSGGADRIVGTKNVCDGQWHHVIVTSDAKTTKLYIDGVQDGPTYANVIVGTGTVLNIGRYYGGGYTWDGWLDEVAVYLDDRNQAEVTRHYRGIPLVVGDKVLESSRAGIARSGNTRSDSYTPFPALTVGGVSVFANLEKNTLRLNYLLNAQTDTCSFSLFNCRPVVGQEVYITAGGPTKLVFGGTIQKAQQRSVKKNLREFWDVDCTDWQWTLNDQRVFEHFPAGMLVSAMAVSIVTKYCPGFSTTRIQASGAATGDVVFQGTPAGDALQSLADLLGWHCLPEPDKTIVFKPAPTVFETAPAPLTSLNFVYDKLVVNQDLSQIMTRVHGVGGGGQTTAPVAVGAVTIPVNEVGWYQTGAGGPFTVINKGVKITYTGVTANVGTTGIGSLTGVSGITQPILQGDTVNVYVVKNDLAAQNALAVLRSPPGAPIAARGIREGMVSDGRWSYVATSANAQAKLDQFKTLDIRGTYTTRDKLTSVGRTITLDIAARGLALADFAARGLSNAVEIQKVGRQFLQSEGGGASRTWLFTVEFATTWSDLVDLLATVTDVAQGD